MPIPIIAIWNGSWIFVAFVGLLGILLMCEWDKLIGLCSRKSINYVSPTLMGLSIWLIWSSNIWIALICLFGAIFVNFLIGQPNQRGCDLTTRPSAWVAAVRYGFRTRTTISAHKNRWLARSLVLSSAMRAQTNVPLPR